MISPKSPENTNTNSGCLRRQNRDNYFVALFSEKSIRIRHRAHKIPHHIRWQQKQLKTSFDSKQKQRLRRRNRKNNVDRLLTISELEIKGSSRDSKL